MSTSTNADSQSTKPAPIFVPAIGKIIELGTLDSFMWATLQGWGTLEPMHGIARGLQPLVEEADPEKQAKELAERLKREEDNLKIIKFASDQAEKNYPYLFALIAVRLWAMAEAAARDIVVEAVKKPSGPPDRSKLGKLKGPIGSMLGADADTQAELVADVLWLAPEGRFRGVGRFDAVLELVGLGGSPPSPIDEVLIELAEVRHCVVHRGGSMDRRFLEACPWVAAKVGAGVPTSAQRFWFYRNAVYWYVLDLVRRWSRWQRIPDLVNLADSMDNVVLGEMKPAWATDKRIQLT